MVVLVAVPTLVLVAVVACARVGRVLVRVRVRSVQVSARALLVAARALRTAGRVLR